MQGGVTVTSLSSCRKEKTELILKSLFKGKYSVTQGIGNKLVRGQVAGKDAEDGRQGGLGVRGSAGERQGQ